MKSPMCIMSDRIKSALVKKEISNDKQCVELLFELWDLSKELIEEEKQAIIEAHGPGFKHGLRPHEYYLVKYNGNGRN